MQPGDFGLGLADAVQAQACLDHGARAAADERVQSLRGNGREPDLLKHVIGRGRQIGRGVDEGAVEVEDDGAVAEVGVHGGSLEWKEARKLLLFQHPVTAGFGLGAFRQFVTRTVISSARCRPRLPQTWASAPKVSRWPWRPGNAAAMQQARRARPRCRTAAGGRTNAIEFVPCGRRRICVRCWRASDCLRRGRCHPGAVLRARDERPRSVARHLDALDPGRSAPRRAGPRHRTQRQRERRRLQYRVAVQTPGRHVPLLARQHSPAPPLSRRHLDQPRRRHQSALCRPDLGHAAGAEMVARGVVRRRPA